MAALHTLAKVPRSGALADALAASLAGAPFLDTIIYAPAQLLPSGEVRELRAVYANGGILKAASPYFCNLLSDKPRDDFGARTIRENAPRLESGDDGTQEKDDDAETESILSLPSSPGSVASWESMPPLDGATAESAAPEKVNDPRKEAKPDMAADGRRVVHLHNVPASTLEAAIFYIYTGEVHFLPLRSHGTAAVEKAQALHSVTHPGRPACSPKSMYRFAHEAELEELRDLAEANLFSQLDESNILAEFFSPFSSQYSSILERQLELLLRDHWTSAAQAALAPLVARIVCGELPHAAPALTMLLLAVPASPPTVPALAPAEDAPRPRCSPIAPGSGAVHSTCGGAARHCAAPEPRPASPAPSCNARPPSPCPPRKWPLSPYPTTEQPPSPYPAEEQPRSPRTPTAEVPCDLPVAVQASEPQRAETLPVIPPCGTPMAEPAAPLACDGLRTPPLTSAPPHNSVMYAAGAAPGCEPIIADATAANKWGNSSLRSLFAPEPHNMAPRIVERHSCEQDADSHSSDPASRPASPERADNVSPFSNGKAHDKDDGSRKEMEMTKSLKKMMKKKKGKDVVYRGLYDTASNGLF